MKAKYFEFQKVDFFGGCSRIKNNKQNISIEIYGGGSVIV